MKILWLCNKAPRAVAECLGDLSNCFGGWLDDMADSLIQNPKMQLKVLFLNHREAEGKKKNLSYRGFQEKNLFPEFQKVLKEFLPDVIHIWGTEYPHSKAMVDAAEACGLLNRCVISIQGLVSWYGKYHFTEGIPHSVIRHRTFRNCLKHDSIGECQREFLCNGELEIGALQKVPYIIGRTDWDQAAQQQINPSAEYCFCNESLRPPFYEAKWDLDHVEPHSIFASQCNYPIKGFHYLLEAMPEILKIYPDAHVYTTGKNLLDLSLKDKLIRTTYQKYLQKLIRKYRLQDHVTFLGMLSGEEMCRQYLRANVFVCPSSIENSPNSLGEAMLVGCPCVSADVGGVKNMMYHGEEGYVYQSSAPYMLAFYVKKIFADPQLARHFSEGARSHAAKTHNRKTNLDTLIKIYERISKQQN